MMRRAIGVIVIVLAISSTRPAAGAPTAAAGWWRDNSVPEAVAPPPSVPPGGLYVAGRLTGPEAVGAVRFDLDDGTAAQSVTLAVASSSGTVVLDACPAAAAWTPVDGGEWSERPKQDCGEGGSRRVSGAVDPAASTVTFDLEPDTGAQVIDLVIVPGIDPATSTTAVFQAAFERPSPTSVAVAGGDDANASTPSQGSQSASAADASDASVSPTESGSFEVSQPPTPASPVTPTASDEAAVGSDTSPLGAAFDAGDSNATAVSRPLEMSGARRAAAIVVAAVMVLLLLWVNRESLLARAGAGVTSTAPTAAPSTAARVVGVGRFARPRRGSAPPL